MLIQALTIEASWQGEQTVLLYNSWSFHVAQRIKYALVIHFINRVESKMFGFMLQCLPSVLLNEQLAYKRGVAGPKKWKPEVI